MGGCPAFFIQNGWSFLRIIVLTVDQKDKFLYTKDVNFNGK